MESNDKTMGLLCYLLPFIGSAIVLLSETAKARPFQRFHATQALGLAVVYVVYEIIANLLAALVCFLPALVLIPMIYYAYQAYQGKVFDIPWLTDFMVKQGWLQRI